MDIQTGLKTGFPENYFKWWGFCKHGVDSLAEGFQSPTGEEIFLARLEAGLSKMEIWAEADRKDMKCLFMQFRKEKQTQKILVWNVGSVVWGKNVFPHRPQTKTRLALPVSLSLNLTLRQFFCVVPATLHTGSHHSLRWASESSQCCSQDSHLDCCEPLAILPRLPKLLKHSREMFSS